MKIYVPRGLPASGKSTWSKTLGVRRWNNDEFREMAFGKRWGGGPEDFVTEQRHNFIKACISENVDVVVDNTNLNPYHVDYLLKQQRHWAGFREVEVKIVDFPVPASECIVRDGAREHSVGAVVILGMVEKWGHLYDWLG